MPRQYIFETDKGPVEIVLDPEGQVVVESPIGPMTMTVWALEEAFIAEFDGFDIPREELRRVYRDFSSLYPLRRSEPPE